MNIISKVFYKIKLRFYKYGSWEYNSIYLSFINNRDVKVLSNGINLKKLSLTTSKNEFNFLLNAYNHAVSLVDSCNASFQILDKTLVVSLYGLKYEIQTSEEIFILNEIFVEGVYNFKTIKPVNDYVLIDIGMNVALASCYFSAIKKIPKVISFEPFRPTFHQAIENIKLNNLTDNITPKNVGLGASDGILKVEYASEFRGQVGMQGIDSIKSKVNNKNIESITIKDTKAEMDKILIENETKRFIFKIDCEGAEYELIPRIPKEILNKTDIIMIEWHIKGPANIEKWLKKHGFLMISMHPNSKSAGMIYAIKG
ncbi:MAG: FkbM family methyltransferase [Marinicellaceae bacterium]